MATRQHSWTTAIDYRCLCGVCYLNSWAITVIRSVVLRCLTFVVWLYLRNGRQAWLCANFGSKTTQVVTSVADFHVCFLQMDARNLAIMFGPSLVRPNEDSMVAMVRDMSDQCRVVESVILHVWVSCTLHCILNLIVIVIIFSLHSSAIEQQRRPPGWSVDSTYCSHSLSSQWWHSFLGFLTLLLVMLPLDHCKHIGVEDTKDTKPKDGRRWSL